MKAVQQGSRYGVLAALAAVLVMGSVLFAPGCQNVEMVSVPNVFRTMPERPIADVPVPVGLRFKNRGSYVFNNNYRVAKLRYTGALHVEDIERFYMEQMPLSRWEPVAQSGAEQRVLEFRNSDESCTLTVQRSGGVSTLDIEIQPRET